MSKSRQEITVFAYLDIFDDPAVAEAWGRLEGEVRALVTKARTDPAYEAIKSDLDSDYNVE